MRAIPPDDAPSPCLMPATELARRISARELSCVEVVQAHLGRIDRLDPMLGAYLHVARDGAMDAAAAADREIAAGRYRGILHGIPVALKDSFHLGGAPISLSSRVLANRSSERDGTVTARLKAAGAIVLGKLNTTEFQSGGMEGRHARNPWDTSRTPGSSSSGAGAALSAGLVTLAIGGDTGGSVRLPAAFCGVVGMNPTFGRISRSGVVPLSWSFDTVGPMARSVRDVAVLLCAIAGPDGEDPYAADRPFSQDELAFDPDLRGLRLGVPATYFFDDLHPEVRDRLHATFHELERMGAALVPIDLPSARYGPAAQWALAFPEAFAYHHALLRRRRADYGDAFVRKITSAILLRPDELMIAHRIRRQIGHEFAAAFERVDAIATPTTPFCANHIDDFGPLTQQVTRFTRTASLLGLPALAIPCGFSSSGLPVSLQLIGKAWDEATLLRIGHGYQTLTQWHLQRPALTTGAPDRTAPAPLPRISAEEIDRIRMRVSSDGLDFLTEADLEPLARLLEPVRRQLAEAACDLDLQGELLRGMRP